MAISKHVRQPARVIVGLCPDCDEVIVVDNDHGSWPYVECKCGWHGATTDIAHRVRYQKGEVLH